MPLCISLSIFPAHASMSFTLYLLRVTLCAESLHCTCPVHASVDFTVKSVRVYFPCVCICALHCALSLRMLLCISFCTCPMQSSMHFTVRFLYACLHACHGVLSDFAAGAAGTYFAYYFLPLYLKSYEFAVGAAGTYFAYYFCT